MPDRETTWIQWAIAGLATLFSGWNLIQHREIDKIRSDSLTTCVKKPDCIEDRERMDKAVERIEKLIERGVEGLHRRIDEALKNKD